MTGSKIQKTEKRYHKTLKKLKSDQLFGFNSIVPFDKYTDKLDARYHVNKKIWKDVKSLWDEAMVPFVVEVLYMQDTLCYRHKYENIMGMLLCDTINAEKDREDPHIAEKLALIALALDRDDIGLENRIFADSLLTDRTEWKAVLVELNSENWKTYFMGIVLPYIQSLAAEAPVKIFNEELGWHEIADRLNVSGRLNLNAVQFLIEDILGYEEACDPYQYNPYWMFGTKHYHEIMGIVSNIQLNQS